MTYEGREKLSANLIAFMLVTDNPAELAELHRVYHKLQMKNSFEKEHSTFGHQVISATRRVEPKPRKAKRVRRAFRATNRLT